jgi:hypothetical protein
VLADELTNEVPPEANAHLDALRGQKHEIDVIEPVSAEVGRDGVVERAGRKPIACQDHEDPVRTRTPQEVGDVCHVRRRDLAGPHVCAAPLHAGVVDEDADDVVPGNGHARERRVCARGVIVAEVERRVIDLCAAE